MGGFFFVHGICENDDVADFELDVCVFVGVANEKLEGVEDVSSFFGVEFAGGFFCWLVLTKGKKGKHQGPTVYAIQTG